MVAVLLSLAVGVDSAGRTEQYREEVGLNVGRKAVCAGRQSKNRRIWLQGLPGWLSL